MSKLLNTDVPPHMLLAHLQGFTSWGFSWPWQLESGTWLSHRWTFAHVYPDDDIQVVFTGRRILGVQWLSIYHADRMREGILVENYFEYFRSGLVRYWNGDTRTVTIVQQPENGYKPTVMWMDEAENL